MNSTPPLVLVTGGLGFIGSHTVVALAEAGFRSLIVDDLSNSSLAVLEALEPLCQYPPILQVGDVRDSDLIGALLQGYTPCCAIHFAGLKAVGESVAMPIDYYSVNVGGTIALMKAMQQHGLRKLVFSSSATVYGKPQVVPIPEDHPLDPQSPYGHSKRMAEQVIADACAADEHWSAACLRYFNPAGAHPSGSIGELPRGIPNNLMPYVSQVATRRRKELQVFGSDYQTPDGTGVRDYLHVMDLAEAHVRALAAVNDRRGMRVFNLGTGRGYSVLEVIREYERVNTVRIPYCLAPRRPGDVDACVADPTLAGRDLGWHAKRCLADMCRDAARFERVHDLQQRSQEPVEPQWTPSTRPVRATASR